MTSFGALEAATAPPDPRHFARAVTRLGEKRPVVARTPIYNAQGLKIIDKGVAIDARLYDRLIQHQLKLPLDECLDVSPSVLGPGLRDELLLLALKDRLCASMLTDLRGGDTLLDEIALIPLPRRIGFQLTLMKETQPALWRHALHSALTAGWLAGRTGLSRYDQRFVAAGGLLHDLGMLHLDPALLRPGQALSREQRRQLYTHPLVTTMLLERCPEYPAELLRAVLEHHEALDGSGYPRHVENAGLSPWGRILSLTELVAGVTADGREAPVTRLALALRMTSTRYDSELTREVQRLVGPLREPPPPSIHPPGQALGDLARIEATYRGWPQVVEALGAPGVRRADAIERIGELCQGALKALAASGATSLPMGQALDDDPQVEGEWLLIAREAAWQLRAVTRQARRRWRLGPSESFPAPLQAWLEGAEALCERWLSSSNAEEIQQGDQVA